MRLLVRSAPAPIAALVVAQAVDGLAPAVVLAASATLLDRAPEAATSAGARSATVTALVVVAVALALARLAGAVVSLLQNLVAHRFSAAVENLRMEAVGALPGLAHFDDPALADRLQASQWAGQASSVVNYGGYLLRWGALSGGAIAVASRLGWWAPALVLASSVPAARTAWRYVGTERSLRLTRMDAWRHAGYHQRLAVGLEPAREARLFGLGDWILARHRQRSQSALDLLSSHIDAQFRRDLATVGVKVGAMAVVLVVAYRRLRAGELTPGDFGASVTALAALGALRWVERFPAELRAAAQFLPDLFRVADLAAADPRLVVVGRESPPDRPVQGIRFEGVRFAYPPAGEGDPAVPVLDGLDLDIPAGSSLALVGENGAGKSTVVKLLCRFYDPDEGRITLDGTDIRDFDLAEWRQRLAVVFQDFTRLPLTVADNVGIGCVDSSGDPALLTTAARSAGAAEVVERLPEGWATVLAKEFGGVDLSGGEWQRVALARALVAREGRDASILVLDEPTAALDVRTEHDLFERFSSLTEGLTSILISHRFSTVRMADRVAVLDGGRVVEEGTHEELVGLGGPYAALYGLQAQRFA